MYKKRKLTTIEKDIINDRRADIEFYISRDNFLYGSEKFEEKEEISKFSKNYLKELNKNHELSYGGFKKTFSDSFW